MNSRVVSHVLVGITLLLVSAPGVAQEGRRGQDLLVAQQTAKRLRGQLDLPEFASLAEKATESVNVTLPPALLSLGCQLMDPNKSEEATAKKLCMGLRAIYVRHYTFDKDYAYPRADIERVKRQLSAPGWTQIVGAISKRENTNVDVFVLIDNDRAQGLSIIATEPREFTIVNIVGSIELDQLHELEGQFSIPELGIEAKEEKKPPPKKTADKKQP
jgi:hypothetical protein